AEEPRVPVDRALAEEERRPAQRVGAAGEDEIGVAFADVVVGGVDRQHAGAAIDLHREGGHRLAHAEAQRGDARGVGFVGEDDAAEDDLVEGVGGKRLAQEQRPPAFDGEIDRRERAGPPARADERRAAAVDDVDGPAYCVGGGVGDGVSPLRDSFLLNAKLLPRARSAPLPLVGRGWGWGSIDKAMDSPSCTTPTPPAFAALRRATLPTRGRVKTELAAFGDFIYAHVSSFRGTHAATCLRPPPHQPPPPPPSPRWRRPSAPCPRGGRAPPPAR